MYKSTKITRFEWSGKCVNYIIISKKDKGIKKEWVYKERAVHLRGP